MNQVYVTEKQIASALRRIFNNNIKIKGSSLSLGSMRNGMRDLVSEVRDDGCFLPENWRKVVKKRFDETATVAAELRRLRTALTQITELEHVVLDEAREIAFNALEGISNVR